MMYVSMLSLLVLIGMCYCTFLACMASESILPMLAHLVLLCVAPLILLSTFPRPWEHVTVGLLTGIFGSVLAWLIARWARRHTVGAHHV